MGLRRLFSLVLMIGAAGCGGADAQQPSTVVPPQQVLDILLVDVPGGLFLMGDPQGGAREPAHWVRVAPFRIMRTEVTNYQFSAFVETTGHITDAERAGAGFILEGGAWQVRPGSSWRRPRGGESTVAGLMAHPVVQVSQRDAAAFCRWAGLRLPREMEWEYAARGADGRRFPWGNKPPLVRGEPIRANLGQPNCCGPSSADGYFYTSPAGLFSAGSSPFGVLDMAGNVWEWTASPLPGAPNKVITRGGGWGSDPNGIRVTIRHADDPDIATEMTGFRCAGDVPGAQRRETPGVQIFR